jgi:hypothetical protein
VQPDLLHTYFVQKFISAFADHRLCEVLGFDILPSSMNIFGPDVVVVCVVVVVVDYLSCICKTITWFLIKMVMTLVPTSDLVLAGITDIQQALLNPPPGLDLPPNHVFVLKQITEVLMSFTIPGS